MVMHTCFPSIGEEAKRVFDDAQSLLSKIMSENLLKAHGVVALYPAFSVGDDIKVLSEDRSTTLTTLFGVRQQVIMYHWTHSMQ